MYPVPWTNTTRFSVQRPVLHVNGMSGDSWGVSRRKYTCRGRYGWGEEAALRGVVMNHDWVPAKPSLLVIPLQQNIRKMCLLRASQQVCMSVDKEWAEVQATVF